MIATKLDVAIAEIKARMGYEPTTYQYEILDWAINGRDHCIVDALAGSGKTATLEQMIIGLNAVWDSKYPLRGQPIAFNKSIEIELNNRIKAENFRARTSNGLGFGALMRDERFKGCTVDAKKSTLIAEEIGEHHKIDEETLMLLVYPVDKLIAMFKCFGYDAIKPYPTSEDIDMLCDRYEIDLPDEIDREYFEWFLFEVFNESNVRFDVIDFNDQVYLPIRLNLPLYAWNKFIFVDESQDLNPIRIELIARLAAKGARIALVGDANQAIYGFMGADPEALDTAAERFRATRFSLPICWRCSKAVIRAAQHLVPEIQAAPNAVEGSVEGATEDQLIENAKVGDMILCRTSAPLVEWCMNFIRDGKKAFVLGSDIGKNLASTIAKIAKSRAPGSTLMAKIDSWGDRQIKKLASNRKNEQKIARLRDKIETLKVLAEGCETANEVKAKIARIFSDDAKGIMLSTIHKAKGLEADCVWIIRGELLPHPAAKQDWARKQERNLEYVAITRARVDLRWVETVGAKFKGRRSRIPAQVAESQVTAA